MANTPTYPRPAPPRILPSSLPRALRRVAWNASLLLAGLALIGLAGEAWLRLTTPFVGRHYPKQFVPGVGVLGKPDSEVRWTNGLDYWTVSRTNSLGFLDREPLDPERAAASCHVAVIGASFVEAKEVAVADKFHVVLEALAGRELPTWTSPPRHSGTRARGRSPNCRSMTNMRGICPPDSSYWSFLEMIS